MPKVISTTRFDFDLRSGSCIVSTEVADAIEKKIRELLIVCEVHGFEVRRASVQRADKTAEA